jgi:hypothetical protein
MNWPPALLLAGGIVTGLVWGWAINPARRPRAAPSTVRVVAVASVLAWLVVLAFVLTVILPGEVLVP